MPADASATNGKPLAFIQALRGIAALAVVLWHASRYLGPYGTGIGGILFAPASAMGVDLFFLISGFIMVHTTRNNDASWTYFLDFAIKRATRIWPVWVVALAAYMILHVDTAFPTDAAKQLWLLHSLFFVPSAGAPGDMPPVYGFPLLGVGWTLNYEMYFYAFFGLSMLLGRWRWQAFFAWLAITLVLIPCCTGRVDGHQAWIDLLAASPAHDHGYSSRYLGMITNPLILMFASGVVIGLVHQSRLAIGHAHLAMALVAAAVLGVAFQYAHPFRTHHGLLNWGLSLVPLMLVLTVASKRVRILAPRWLVYVGDISFSLYLFHPTVQESCDRVARAFGHVLAGYSPIIVTTLLSVGVAALSHRYLERGLCERLKRRALHGLSRSGTAKPDDAVVHAPSMPPVAPRDTM